MNFLNPGIKLFLASSMFCQVALSAAGNTIFDGVPLLAVNSVNTVVDKITVKSAQSSKADGLGRGASAVKAFSLGYVSKLVSGQPKFQASFGCTIEDLNIRFIEGGLSIAFTLESKRCLPGFFDLATSAALGAPPHRGDNSTTIALKCKSSTTTMAQYRRVFVFGNFLQNNEVSDSVTRLYISRTHTNKELILS